MLETVPFPTFKLADTHVSGKVLVSTGKGHVLINNLFHRR